MEILLVYGVSTQGTANHDLKVCRLERLIPRNCQSTNATAVEAAECQSGVIRFHNSSLQMKTCHRGGTITLPTALLKWKRFRWDIKAAWEFQPQVPFRW